MINFRNVLDDLKEVTAEYRANRERIRIAAGLGCRLQDLNTKELWTGVVEGNTLIVETGKKGSLKRESRKFITRNRAVQEWWEERWDKIYEGYTAYTDSEGNYDNSRKTMKRMYELTDVPDKEKQLITAIKKGADPNGHFGGITLAFTAARREYFDLLSLLIEKGCDLNVPNTSLTAYYSLKLPLEIAINTEDRKMADMLIKNGAKKELLPKIIRKNSF